MVLPSENSCSYIQEMTVEAGLDVGRVCKEPWSLVPRATSVNGIYPDVNGATSYLRKS